MMREGLDRADKDGLPVYLEATPEGSLMYPKFGFQLIDSHSFGRHVMEFYIRPASHSCDKGREP